MSADYPNIDRWLGRYLKKIAALDDDEYVVLRHELEHAAEYETRLKTLDAHLDVAGQLCQDFERLISERKGFGTNIDGANQMLLDKLAEIRAVVGLDECGFTGIAFSTTPDLTARKDGKDYAIEVTRISASGGIRELSGDYEIKILPNPDEPDVLPLQIVTKALAKREQLINAGFTGVNHIIWISVGRDYFLAGRYEPDLAGLRRHMPAYLRTKVEQAASDNRIKRGYPELQYFAASPEASAPAVLIETPHDL